MGKKFVGNATGMVGPNQPKRDSLPSDVKLSNKAEGIFSGVTIAWELAGHRLVGGEQLLLHYLFSFLFFSLLPVHLPLSQPVSFLTSAFLVLFLHPTGGK